VMLFWDKEVRCCLH